MESSNTEEIVGAYLAIRAAREDILHKYEAEDGALKEQQAQIEASLLDICNKINASNIKTNVGTATRILKERFVCNDWDNFGEFLLEHKAVGLLERRIHQGNFKQFLTEHEADGLPPGVNVMREYGIRVRKA